MRILRPLSVPLKATELLLGGPSPPLGLFLESAERHQVALFLEHAFDGVIIEAADQLVPEVGDAHVEAGDPPCRRG